MEKTMSNYANGTIYGKYIKVKSGSVGVKKCSAYINDPEKIQSPYTENKADTAYAKDVIHYLKNDAKATNSSTKKRLVSGHNCCPDTAVQEFNLIEKLYHAHKSEKLAPGQKANQAFHIILSYKGRDTDPKIIHEMGCEFARRLCGDEFQALITTHLNTNNYHNHILVNAYALDGHHKFKDSYHVYQNFRRIANEISLEYGLPVFVNGEKEKPYKSWKKFIATKEGESWKENIIHDLEESISLAHSYDEVLKVMEKKGYEIQHNPKSITFKKDEGMVRDRRLGYNYTYEGICNTLEKKSKEESYQKRVEEYAKNKEKRMEKTSYPFVYISRYDRYGKRRNLLIHILIALKESISQAITTADISLSQTRDLENLDLKKAKTQQKLLDEAIEIADKYDISTMEILNMKLRELHAKNTPYQRAIFNLEDYQENAGKLQEFIKKYRELEPVLLSEGIDKKDIVFIPDSTVIEENQAKLNPMKAKTRSDLFQAIHNSRYRLTRKFKTLTETQAQQIIKAIRNEQTEDLPYGLNYGKNRRKSTAKKEKFNDTNASISPTKRKPIELKNYSKETRQAILEFKEIADALASYGLTNHKEMDNFEDSITKNLTELELQKTASNEINTEIKKLFKLKKTIEQFSTSIFVHRPFPLPSQNNISAEKTTSLVELISGKGKCSTKYDILLYMKFRLAKLPDISLQELNLMKIPNPEEYRFIHDLQLIYPEKSDIHCTSPKDIHYLILKLKSERFFEKEIRKELEKEMKEKQHEQNNTGRN